MKFREAFETRAAYDIFADQAEDEGNEGGQRVAKGLYEVPRVLISYPVEVIALRNDYSRYPVSFCETMVPYGANGLSLTFIDLEREYMI